MNIISKFFIFLETRFVPPRLSIWRTLYFNFRVLPISKAIHLPFYIYGKVHFPMLAGRVEINADIRKGMIKIGRQDPFCVSSGLGFISVSHNAKVIFNGPCMISTNSCLRLFAGELVLGKYTWFGSNVRVILNGKRIEIGDYTRIPFQSVIMNSSFHSVVDLDTLSISPHIKDIIIGRNCWIGNNSTISGGTKLKEGTIVGAGSYLNKDFTCNEEEHQLLAGRPAKLIKSGLARVWSPVFEQKIIKWFAEHPGEKIYRVTSLKEDYKEDLEKEFE